MSPPRGFSLRHCAEANTYEEILIYYIIYMDCEKAHMYLLNEENQAICPFCDEQLADVKSVETRCSNKPNITVDGFKIVCTNCGLAHGFQSANEFVDFYENIHRIRKKSVYPRKHHILNVINDIAQKNNIQIDYYNREKILRIFALIDQVSSKLDTGRKRTISVNFILKQLFDILLLSRGLRKH